jgi:hypothetical protein
MEEENGSEMDSNVVKDAASVAKADVAPIRLPWPADNIPGWNHFDMLE